MSAHEHAAVEVVPASQEAEVHHDIGYWEAEWVATELGIAITTEELRPQRFEIRGLAHVWSLRTGKVIRTIRSQLESKRSLAIDVTIGHVDHVTLGQIRT